MIVYRHPSLVEPPDLLDWEHRESVVAVCHQQGSEFQYAGVADPVFWRIPAQGPWRPLGDGWEATLVRNAAGVVPSRDLARLHCWAPVLTVEDAKGEQWLAPVILTQDGHRAFPVSYTGADFLPSPTEEQQRAEAIAQEARAETLKALDGGAGLPLQAACRWASVLLAITSHVSPAAIAELGILDDVLVRRVLISAAGVDRRLDAEIQ